MFDAKTIVDFPVSARGSDRARVRSHKSAPALRNRARAYPSPVVPMFQAGPQLRERSHAGLGMLIAFGFSAAAWAGIAALIF